MMKIEENISLAPFTTFKVGGVARYFVSVTQKQDLFDSLSWAKEKNLSVFILGGGSNVLISDSGLAGLVIRIQIKGISVSDLNLTVSAGENLAKLVQFSTEHSLSGLEWAVGIPGTVGGAIRGNAGAFGKSISLNVEEVEVINLNTLDVNKFKKEKCLFDYRDSIFKKDSSLVILSVVLKLEQGEENGVRRLMLENAKSRASSCDYGNKSAGCFFKNISWDKVGIDKGELVKAFPEFKKVENKYKLPAGFLIQEVGLSGVNIGEAFVSEKHCNYILNKGSATAVDIKLLADICKEKVYKKFKIKIEEEVQLVGKF
ncbi:MAG: UDP-N-acetylenolpyruvoylglucosamine reductase [Parcubacteria group bacterium CG10_big_fil_rev_8_21_14_0_10_38_31]|nr:MAG: UDP-N-acetylenolpyruvoylglucosamine reductase [Parcubacteria group bacterium CG10_big_fil_rev_8_21_14_0_10_38_31]